MTNICTGINDGFGLKVRPIFKQDRSQGINQVLNGIKKIWFFLKKKKKGREYIGDVRKERGNELEKPPRTPAYINQPKIETSGKICS